MRKPARAICLISGLDSILALKLLSGQEIEVVAIHFSTPFIDEPEALRKLIPEVEVITLKEDYLKLVKAPRYGYGRNLNPCIDCRIYMLAWARSLMVERKADFVCSGEVLGQRPFSQPRWALELTEARSGLKGLLLRPLSAQLLPPTQAELEGLVDRSRLLGLQGRSRKTQIMLAKKLGIEPIPTPAGGCRLTEPGFVRRLKEGLDHGEEGLREVMLLRYGRHFRLPGGAKAVVGRNELENQQILEMAWPEDLLLDALGVGSPLVLLIGGEEDLKIAARICVRYSDARGRAWVRAWHPKGVGLKLLEVEPLADAELERLRI
jgi:hypothetical protein